MTAGWPTSRASTAGPTSSVARSWWRPLVAEEYQPPACYECKGLARGVCRNCHSKYCAEHAGGTGLCKACNRSANMGLYVFAVVFGLMLLLFVINWLFG